MGIRSPRIRNTIGVPTLYHCWAFGRMGKKIFPTMTQKRFLYMDYSLNSLKEVTYGIRYGTFIEVTKGDTWSLDYGSCLSGVAIFKGATIESFTNQGTLSCLIWGLHRTQ